MMWFFGFQYLDFNTDPIYRLNTFNDHREQLGIWGNHLSYSSVNILSMKVVKVPNADVILTFLKGKLTQRFRVLWCSCFFLLLKPSLKLLVHICIKKHLTIALPWGLPCACVLPLTWSHLGVATISGPSGHTLQVVTSIYCHKNAVTIDGIFIIIDHYVCMYSYIPHYMHVREEHAYMWRQPRSDKDTHRGMKWQADNADMGQRLQ